MQQTGTTKANTPNSIMAERRPKRVSHGILKGHYKSGRTYYPELVATFNFAYTDWIKNDLPDLLWPMLIVHLYGDEGIIIIRNLQELVLDALPRSAFEHFDAALDGRLTSIERFDPEHRPTVEKALRKSSDLRRAFPSELTGVLSLFEDTPGRWLTVDFLKHKSLPARAESIILLTEAISHTALDPHGNALIKTPTVMWKARTGTLRMSDSHAHELLEYPRDLDMRDKTDGFIRSVFGGLSNMLGESAVGIERDGWSRDFWLQSWRLTPCFVDPALNPMQEIEESTEADECEDSETLSDESNESGLDIQEAQSLSTDYSRRLGQLFERFMEKAVTSDTSMESSSLEPFEVVTGLVSRSFRALLVAFKSPYLWNSEHGSGIIRMLFETDLSLQWMYSNRTDGSYKQYQSYGKGKGKLYRLHLKELLEKSQDHSEDSIAGVLARLLGRISEERPWQFQEVSLDSTFAGVSMRQMASELGQLDHYRHVYQPASGVTHGEWWTLEESTMIKCLNPLHRFHLMPALDIRPQIRARFPTLALMYFRDILTTAYICLGIIVDDQTDGTTDLGAHPTDQAGRPKQV